MNDGTTEESPALRLARYLKEYVGIKSTTVSDVDKYEEPPLWYADMPQDRDCWSPLWVDEYDADSPWLLVKKQHFESIPPLPEITLPWVDDQTIRRATLDFPDLLLSTYLPGDVTDVEDGETPLVVLHHLSDHPEVQQAYDSYRPAWEAWSKEQRRREAIQRVYAKLFRLHTQILKQGEFVEVVLGLGLLDWRARRTEVTVQVRRHILVARVDLRFDAAKGEISIVPPGEGARLHIEDDMLEAALRPARSHCESVEMQLREIGDLIWESTAIHEAIKTWAGALSADSDYSDKLLPLRSSGGAPVVSFAPALILRKRTQAGMLRIYNQLIEQLAKPDGTAPDGWQQLVDDMGDDDAGTEAYGEPRQPRRRGVPEQTSEVYFPLPANREQRRIVEAVNQKRGVLVQGPPGTGKSHTIANLMCHLLATGKRILVTAENARALQVLKEKLPEELQPLCVSLMGQGSDSFAELSAAVQGITRRHAIYTAGDYDDQIAEAEEDIESARRKLAELDTEIRSLREGETIPHSLFDNKYHGTPSVIAARVATEAADYNWLRIPRDAAHEPPLASTEMVDWLRACRRYPLEAIAEANLRFPASQSLQTPDAFAQLVAAEREAASAVEAIAAARAHVAYTALRALEAPARENLRTYLRAIEKQRIELLRGGIAWVRQSLSECLAGQRARWQSLCEGTDSHLRLVEDLMQRLGKQSVMLPQGEPPRKIRVDAEAAMNHLNQGGKWKQFGVLTPAPLKGRTYLKDTVLVDGQGAASVAALQAVCDYIDKEQLFSELDESWSGVGVPPANGDARTRLAVFKESLSTLQSCLKCVEVCQRLMKSMAASRPPVPEPSWLDGEASHWLEVVDAVDVETRLEQAARRVQESDQALTPLSNLHDSHPVVARMLTAIAAREVHAYSQAHATLLAAEETRRAQESRARVEVVLARTVPGLIDAVASTLEDVAWDTRLAAWEQAWCWCLADSWLDKRGDFDYKQQLWKMRKESEARLGQLIAKVAELRAWAHFLARLTPAQSAALKGWQAAVQAQGKGTGKSAKLARLKLEAREHMETCRDAIPIWIMPRYLVADMVDVAPGRYDLVIVDEASQLGIESLFLFYIAKKMVVVGDEQQISPSGVGIADDAIAALQRYYLQGIKYHVALSPQSSLYANAKIRFNQNIVLREHFRCMPEIIQFSNDLCYASNGTPLDPLRTYAGNRLQPLVLRHVASGYRQGSSQYAQNPPEADAIVAHILACIQNPRYTSVVNGQAKKLTMGVISLQGDAQAQLIEQKLMKLLDPAEIEERRIICGDAYAFQGDERHVIFLSMVAAPGDRRIGALANEAAQQRFNVAASRAQDQLWLFHSAQIDDLSPTCMRRRLLKYMLNPFREASRESEQRFDSKFERDVYRIITARGFHVRTQVVVGDPTNHRYRIDLVVEGMQGRLAVECDGDEWHGAERYEADMARQRDLERAGWQFVRIRGGDFYRNAERALEPLWTELERLGILPGGIDESATEPPRAETSTAEEPAQDANVGGDEDEVVEVDSEEAEDAAYSTWSVESGPQDGNEPKDAAIPASQSIRLEAPDMQPADSPVRTHTVAPRPAPTAQAYSGNGRLAGHAPYIAFEGYAGPDPRSASLEEVADGLCRIIAVEQPMLAKRAYILYLRGCGIKRMGKELHRTMNKAMQSAITRGIVVNEDEMGKGGVTYTIVRTKGSAPVLLRERGPRDFEEIPASELLLACKQIAERENLEHGSEAHYRAVLESFDLKRLTTQVNVTLSEVLENEFDYVESLATGDPA